MWPKSNFSFESATYLKVTKSLSSASVPKNTTTGLEDDLSMKAYKSDAFNSYEAGPVFFVIHAIISAAFLPPSKSIGDPLTKNFNVGYPCTSYFSATDDSTVASTLASGTYPSPAFLSSFAAAEYSGASFLQ